MSSLQLIILWWGFIALLLLMLLGAKATLTFSVAGFIVLLLIFYSFGKHHRSSRHKMMLAVGLPMMLLGIGGFISGGSVDNPQLDLTTNSGIILPNDSVQILSPQIKHKFLVDKISGVIKNNSTMNIQKAVLKVLLDANTTHAEEWFVPLQHLNLAPGQSASFETKIGDFHFRANAKWKWNFQVVNVMGG